MKNKASIWLNEEKELYGYETLKQKLNYLQDKQVRAGIVFEPWHYKYSMAVNYLPK